MNRTIHTLSASCTVIKVMYNILHGVSYSKWHTVKEGTISYSIQRLYSTKGDIIYVLYYCIPRSGSRESPSFVRCLKHMEYNIPISDAGETLSFIQYLRCIGVSIDNRSTGHLKVYYNTCMLPTQQLTIVKIFLL